MVWYEGAGTSDRRYLHADERGSIIAVTNDAGQAIAVNSCDEFGIPGANNQGRFQYTGQKWIPELGLYDYKARMYSPTLGRFMQTDPTGYADGLNWYDYVGGDPVNKSDPSGQTAPAICTGTRICTGDNNNYGFSRSGGTNGGCASCAIAGTGDLWRREVWEGTVNGIPAISEGPWYAVTPGSSVSYSGSASALEAQRINVDKSCANVPAASDPGVQAKALEARRLATTTQQRNPDGPPFREYGFSGRRNFFPSFFGDGYVTGDMQSGGQRGMQMENGWFDTFDVHTHSGPTGPSDGDIRNATPGIDRIIIGRDATLRCYTGK